MRCFLCTASSTCLKEKNNPSGSCLVHGTVRTAQQLTLGDLSSPRRQLVSILCCRMYALFHGLCIKPGLITFLLLICNGSSIPKMDLKDRKKRKKKRGRWQEGVMSPPPIKQLFSVLNLTVISEIKCSINVTTSWQRILLIFSMPVFAFCVSDPTLLLSSLYYHLSCLPSIIITVIMWLKMLIFITPCQQSTCLVLDPLFWGNVAEYCLFTWLSSTTIHTPILKPFKKSSSLVVHLHYL